MSYAAEHQAVRERFDAYWTQTAIAWPGLEFDPEPLAAAGSGWIRPTVLPVSADQADMRAGAALYRHESLLRVQVFVPANQGEGLAWELVDDLAEVFRSEVADGIRYGVPVPRRIGVDADGWFQVNVDVPFTRDTVF